MAQHFGASGREGFVTEVDIYCVTGTLGRKDKLEIRSVFTSVMSCESFFLFIYFVSVVKLRGGKTALF